MHDTFLYDCMFDDAVRNEGYANAKVVAVITDKNGNIYGRGVNSKKTHPFQKRFAKNENCIHLHAEIDAIRSALKMLHVDDLEKYNLFILRVKKDGPRGKFIPGLACPCEGCRRAIATFGIKNVYFTKDGKRGFSCL